MIFYQPYDQVSIGRGQFVITAKVFGIHCAQLGVITAASFADIMKEGGNIEQPRVSQPARNPGGDRKSVGIVSAHKSTGIGDDLHGVCVHGIGMEQIKLHLTYYGPKGGKIGAHHAMARHSAQLFSHVVRHTQDLHEEVSIDFTSSKRFVN